MLSVRSPSARGTTQVSTASTAGHAVGTRRSVLEYKREREGTHVVAVDPARTSKERAACGAESDKPLWVREHSCRSCGFTADRD